MKLKKVVLMAIHGNTDLRRKVQEVLGISAPTMVKKLQENDDDFTKAAALKVIREELGLTDSEILEELGTVENSAAR